MIDGFTHQGQRFHVCNDGKYRTETPVLEAVPEDAANLVFIAAPDDRPHSPLSASYGIKIAPGVNYRQQEFIDRPETQAKLKSGEMRYMSKTDDEAHI